MSVRRPLVRYHGGKWRLAPWIVGFFPPHRVYVEPFGGGGSVLLRKPRSYAEVYNDLDGEIVNLFRVVRDHGEELERRVALTPFSRDEFLDSYEPSDDPVEQARRTALRSFAGFGSASVNGKRTGFRKDSNRPATTPAHDWMNYPARLPDIVKRLSGVVIENSDALEVITDFDRTDCLFYADPPYVHETRALGNPYCDKAQYRHEMTDDDHRRMAEVLHGVKGMVALSGYDCPLYRDLFGGWHVEKCAAHADGARDRTECLWLNPALMAKRGASLFTEAY